MINKKVICIILIILFHVVGLYGFLTHSLNSLFIQLVPFHLLLMLVLLILSHPDKNQNYWLFMLAIYILSFIVEVLGVRTGAIFGTYYYGKTLGFKLVNVPLLIGINWMTLILCTGILVKKLNIKRPIYSSIIGALILVFMDILIEPIAIKYDYWSWAGSLIPLKNYAAWFIVSYILLRLFFTMEFKKDNNVAIVLFFSQIAFFAVLNIWAFR